MLVIYQQPSDMLPDVAIKT